MLPRRAMTASRPAFEELCARAPWGWVREFERTLLRVGRAFSDSLCSAPGSAWQMRPSRFEQRVLQALEMLGVRHVVREVCISLRTTPQMRRAMAHPASGSFHVPDVVSLRLDMVWWDAAAGLLRILEVDGTQHAATATTTGHFFFRCDPSVAHRARCRDMIKDALVARAGGRGVALLRIPPALERPSHGNNVALIRTLHAWLSGGAEAPAGPAPQLQHHFPLPPPPCAGGGPPPRAARARPRHPRSASLPPLRRPAPVNSEDERRARTVFVRARRAAARTPAEERMWRARQVASDSRKMVRDDTLRPYPPAWWREARAALAASSCSGVPRRAGGEGGSPSGSAAEEDLQQLPAKRRRRADGGQRV